jgi:hypothetical protein
MDVKQKINCALTVATNSHQDIRILVPRRNIRSFPAFAQKKAEYLYKSPHTVHFIVWGFFG